MNLAARLQSLTKDKRFDILMSQDLAQEVKHLVLAQDLGLNQVRGFDNDVHVFGLLGAVDSNGEMKIEDPVLEAKLAGRGPGICHDAPENLLDVA